MKPYPAYKESGVEWLGEVPMGWEVARLRQIIANIESGTSVNAMDIPAVDGETAVLKTSCVFAGVFNPTENKVVAADEIDRVSCPLRFDSLIVSRMNTPDLVGAAGHVLFAPENIYLPDRIWQITFVAAFSRFVYFFTLAPLYRDQVRIVCAGTSSSMQNLSQDNFKNFLLPLPPLPEQQAIAAFLDRETAKIDGLIEEQRRLIALLAEKRQATISHAVTRGLNPSARLKPSGVDWLGDVPQGWEVVPLKRLGRFAAGAGFPHEEQGNEGEELPFFKVNALGKAGPDEVLLPGEVDTISRETASRLRATIFPKGAIVFAKIGAALLLGRIRTLPCEACVDNNMMGLIPDRDQSRDYLKIAMSLLHFDLISNPGTVPSLNEGQIAEQRIPFPPIEEQLAIVEYVSRVSKHLAALTDAASTMITLMQERRAALISAAVTGKIDVREAKATPARSQQSLHISIMLGGVLIAALGRHPSMGRMLVQKHLFMAEAYAGVDELQGNYERKAAGPYDSGLQHRVEADLVAAGLLRVAQIGGSGSRVEYEFLGDAVALRADLAAALGDRMARFDYLTKHLGALSKAGTEAVATLYAAWNDFLIDGQSPSRDDIIREVLENWHPEKPEKFTKDDLGIWLDWMERHNIVPNGTGPKTQTGRLFP